MRLLHLAEKNVRRSWGEPAFARLGHELQVALIAREYLVLIAMQDEGIAPETIRRLINEGWTGLSEWEWKS